jgi:hypothetical protein
MKVKQFSELAKDFMPARAYWLSLDPTPQKIENVRCLPWQEGLEEIMGGSCGTDKVGHQFILGKKFPPI